MSVSDARPAEPGVRSLSFMRGVVENAIRSMSAEERLEAMQAVTQQMIESMSEAERVEALVYIVRLLADGLPPERVLAALDRHGER
jgi:hypothetical protein